MRHGEQIIIYLIEVKVVAYGINRHLYKNYFVPKVEMNKLISSSLNILRFVSYCMRIKSFIFLMG